ncbi:uncharacterized protein [Globicephala melas]|uniref:uncharacterized protein isoform X2 n=1 Tax=Globicephala melas TaxID=9731 RepID=UPI00293D5699|nr:uncharacterized protein LOC132597978 isoform X1 [Globicephala melas]
MIFTHISHSAPPLGAPFLHEGSERGQGTQPPVFAAPSQLQSTERAAAGLPEAGDESAICGARATSWELLRDERLRTHFPMQRGAQAPRPAWARLRQERALSLVLKVAAARASSPGLASQRRLVGAGGQTSPQPGFSSSCGARDPLPASLHPRCGPGRREGAPKAPRRRRRRRRRLLAGCSQSPAGRGSRQLLSTSADQRAKQHASCASLPGAEPYAGLSLSWPLSLRSTGSGRAGSAAMAQGPSCSAACGIFPDRGTNPCPLHRQADSQPLRHQGSPQVIIFKSCKTSQCVDKPCFHKPAPY